MATYTTAQALGELKRLGNYRTRAAVEIGAEGDPDEISGDLILAVGSRESNLRNINGGGYFANPNDPKSWVDTHEDAGCFELNRGVHEAWLRSVPGCDEGSWKERYFDADGAFPKTRCPGFTRAAKKVRSVLRYNRTYALSQGVAPADALLVAICGYNGGIGTAVVAYNAGKDPNAVTTGGDYGTDVLARRSAIKRARRQLGW